MLDTLFIASANAQEVAAEAGAPSAFAQFVPLIFVVAVFYFLIIRPQQKKFKQHQAMLAAVKRGDRVITGGGVHGKVTKVNDDGTLTVNVAEGVDITVEQSTVNQVVAKPGKDKEKVANDNG